MPSTEVLTWILSGCMVILSALFSVVWSMIRAETKEHARQIELKANADRLQDLDRRMEKELQDMQANNEKLIEKLEYRQQRDIEAVSAGFREQISSIKDSMKVMEANILKQMEFMFNSIRENK